MSDNLKSYRIHKSSKDKIVKRICSERTRDNLTPTHPPLNLLHQIDIIFALSLRGHSKSYKKCIVYNVII